MKMKLVKMIRLFGCEEKVYVKLIFIDCMFNFDKYVRISFWF